MKFLLAIKKISTVSVKATATLRPSNSRTGFDRRLSSYTNARKTKPEMKLQSTNEEPQIKEGGCLVKKTKQDLGMLQKTKLHLLGYLNLSW